ncbi:hypothetical protein LguiA_029139 [Lonicera macranthoides]
MFDVSISQSFCNVRMGSMPVEFLLLLLVEMSFAIADVLLQLELILLVQVELYVPCCHMVPPSMPYVDCKNSMHTLVLNTVQIPRGPVQRLCPCFLVAVLTPMCSTAPTQHLCAPLNLTVHTPVHSSVQRPYYALPWLLPLCRAHAHVQHGSTACGFSQCPFTPCFSRQWPHGLSALRRITIYMRMVLVESLTYHM